MFRSTSEVYVYGDLTIATPRSPFTAWTLRFAQGDSRLRQKEVAHPSDNDLWLVCPRVGKQHWVNRAWSDVPFVASTSRIEPSCGEASVGQSSGQL